MQRLLKPADAAADWDVSITPLVQRVKKTTVRGKFPAANFRHKKHSKAALVLELRVTGLRVSGDVAPRSHLLRYGFPRCSVAMRRIGTRSSSLATVCPNAPHRPW